MILFVTDSADHYKKSVEKNKLLINGTLILECPLLSEEKIQQFNNNNNNIETEAGEKMLAELYALCEKLKGKEIKANKFINAIPGTTEKLFALLYETFSTKILSKHIFAIFLDRFISASGLDSITTVQMDFANGDFSFNGDLFPGHLKKIKFIPVNKNSKSSHQQNNLSQFKNIFFYTPYYIFRKTFSPLSKTQKKGKKHILLLVYDVEHHFQVLSNFLELVKQNKNIHLSIVISESGWEKTSKEKWMKHKSENTDIFLFSEFRKPLFKYASSSFAQTLSEVVPEYNHLYMKNVLMAKDLKYSWMNNVFVSLRPDVCFHLTTHEIGRVMASVASYHKTPSLQVDYALFSDWYTVESRIRFTARASINEAMIEVWKKRNDPTPEHYAIGFCKLDNMKKPLLSKEKFFNANHFDLSRKTILFTGTWNTGGLAYGFEQEKILSQLSEICHKHNFNLIIKKHPLEKENSASEIIAANKYPFQKVFEHNELSITDAIFYADFVTNQMSSIVLECLYFGKPFCYLTTSENSNQTDTSLLKGEKFAATIHIDKFDAFVATVFDSGKIAELTEEMKSKKERYLFKTDGKSSERLLDLLMHTSFR